MKKFYKSFAILSLMVLFAGSVCMAEDAVQTVPAEQKTEECSGWENNLCNMGRGLVNIVTCFLELPRCLIYYNSQVPVMGAVVGACQGAGLTAVRAFAGVADFASFGFMTDSIYESCFDFNEYVWESRWVPKQ